MNTYGQILTAMVTPFDQNDEVDFTATKTLVNHLISTGTEGLIVAGTTGESPTLTTNEKIDLFKYVVEVVDGRVPVIAGTGSNNTKESIELTIQAEATGVDGIMLVAPYYNRPSQEGMYQHFKTIAEATKLPIMLYNIPGRSAVNMEPETIVRLSMIANITSVKEASADLNAMAEIISQSPEGFMLYSGDDSLALPVLAIGGAGVVSVSSHIIGNEMQEMVRQFNNGEVQAAAASHRNILPAMEALFAAPNPSPVKAALNMIGIHVGSVRLPLVPLTNEEKVTLHKALKLNITEAC